MSPASSPPATIETAIRDLASAAGIPSLYALRRAAKVDRNTVRSLVRGETRPRRSTIAKLAVVLGVDASLLARLVGGRHG